MRHPRPVGLVADHVLRLALGAHEQHLLPLGGGLADEAGGLAQALHRLRQVQNVDAVARAEDEGRHFRVPAPGLMAEVDAGFKQISH